jgi:hypothetical protein
MIYKEWQVSRSYKSISNDCPYEKCHELFVTCQVIVDAGGEQSRYWINDGIMLNQNVTDLFCGAQSSECLLENGEAS